MRFGSLVTVPLNRAIPLAAARNQVASRQCQSTHPFMPRASRGVGELSLDTPAVINADVDARGRSLAINAIPLPTVGRVPRKGKLLFHFRRF